jgi:alpha-tubulin suppressor-like RCC1 family protein
MLEVPEVIAISSRSAYVFLQKEDLRVKQVVAAADRNYVLLEDSKKVIVWGSNEKGELGLGTYENEDSPKWLEFFSR